MIVRPQIEGYPADSSAIGIIALARKRQVISWNQLLAGKILLAKDLDSIFALTSASSLLILPDESNTQGSSLGGRLVCSGSSQLRRYAPLASHAEIASASMVV
jgi:hypothetical protein